MVASYIIHLALTLVCFCGKVLLYHCYYNCVNELINGINVSTLLL